MKTLKVPLLLLLLALSNNCQSQWPHENSTSQTPSPNDGPNFDEDVAKIMGDAVFTVPLPSENDYSDQPDFTEGALCYEVQGRTGYIYNLISDQCVTVNSFYNKSNDTDKFNVITAIAILAEGTSGECHTVKVKRGQCQVYVDGFPFNGTFDEDGILVKTGSHGDVVTVVVPDCQERGHPGFMFQISCTQAESKEALELEALYVDGLLSTSHGLLGQFWNINMTKEPYVGPYRGRQMSAEEKMYKVKILDPIKGDVVRSFLTELEQIQWDGKELPCLYAGSSQASSTSKDPGNGNVIEGKYSDYQMDHLSSVNFKYRKYREGGECENLYNDDNRPYGG